VLFEVANPERQLLSGMSAQVSFIIASAHDAVTVPIGVLNKPDGDDFYSVNVVGANQHAQARRVQIGIRNHEQAQVLSGLAPGEEVVVDSALAPDTTPSSPASQPRKQVADNAMRKGSVN
jgi:macrolide-specific efflux system membrane fusion protein